MKKGSVNKLIGKRNSFYDSQYTYLLPVSRSVQVSLCTCLIRLPMFYVNRGGITISGDVSLTDKPINPVTHLLSEVVHTY